MYAVKKAHTKYCVDCLKLLLLTLENLWGSIFFEKKIAGWMSLSWEE